MAAPAAFLAPGHVPFLTTFYGRLDGLEVRSALRAFGWTPLVSVSEAQRAPVAGCELAGNGAPRAACRLLAGRSRFAERGSGRFSDASRQMPAWMWRSGSRSQPAAAFGSRRRPARLTPGISRRQCGRFLRSSVCEVRRRDPRTSAERLFSARRRRCCCRRPGRTPFGQAAIEAAACGTPVIEFGTGTACEVIEHGVSGFVVRDGAAAIGAVHGLGYLQRAAVRDVFDRRLTSRRMAEAYLEVYEKAREAFTRARGGHRQTGAFAVTRT